MTKASVGPPQPKKHIPPKHVYKKYEEHKYKAMKAQLFKKVNGA